MPVCLKVILTHAHCFLACKCEGLLWGGIVQCPTCSLFMTKLLATVIGLHTVGKRTHTNYLSVLGASRKTARFIFMTVCGLLNHTLDARITAGPEKLTLRN